MKWAEFLNSPYLSASDFAAGEEKRLTVATVKSEAVGRERDSKPVVYFRERDVQPLVLNRTNAKAIAAVCGPEAGDAAGRDPGPARCPGGLRRRGGARRPR